MPQYYDAWAEYICRYIEEFRRRGFVVSCISLQNEPHASQIWDSCVWSAREERSFLVDCMKPALIRHGLSDVQIYIWDHNKERILDRAVAVLDEKGRVAADGIAFHWYSGDHFEALRKVHELFPEKKLMLSENCFEYRIYGPEELSGARNIIAHEIIGDIESGTNSFLDWNILLDERGGPNYVNNFCLAPFLYHKETKELRRQVIYEALWHFAHFIPSGSRRILSSSFSGKIEKTAFARPDGSIVLVLLNQGTEKIIDVSINSEILKITVPEAALITLEIKCTDIRRAAPASKRRKL